MKASIPLAAILLWGLGACGGGPSGRSADTTGSPGSGNPTHDSTGAATAQSSITFALPSASFSGNSVLICGERDLPADPKYRCVSALGTPDGGTCSCFNFAQDGSLIDPSTGLPPVINDLCPSEDFPNADWTFTYSVFTEADCGGTQLNDGTNNFTCFDSRDLLSQANPNESIEPLVPGPNENHILCLTTNASKTFNFESCAINTTATSIPAVQRFDCGCTPADGGGCDCGPHGIGPGDLPPECSFETTPASCNILCPLLVIGKSATSPSGGLPNVVQGQTVVYHFVIFNLSSVHASLTVTDDIPAGMTFLSASTGGVLVGNTVTWTNVGLPGGLGVNLFFSVSVGAPAVTPTTYSNTAFANGVPSNTLDLFQAAAP